MGRLILAIVLAPVIWGLVSVPTNLLVIWLYGDRVGNPTSVAAIPFSYLALSVVLACGYSIIAGYAAARIAGDGAWRTGIGAGIAILAVGVPVQISAWEALPLWYHLLFLASLVPFTLIGTRLGNTPQLPVG